MNMQTVGMENLPNVYIEKISISKNERTNVVLQSIRVTVVMCDSETNPTWRERIDGLKIKCSLIFDDRIAQLNAGELSLYNVDVSESLTQVEACNDLVYYRKEGEYFFYKKVFEFNTNMQFDNLNAYVASYIDDLRFGIEQFDKFYGPMAGEKIFVGGEINKQSGYFYYPDTNEEYAGPVHLMGSNYMAGSEHSDGDETFLTYVQEENFKIIEVPNITQGIISVAPALIR